MSWTGPACYSRISSWLQVPVEMLGLSLYNAMRPVAQIVLPSNQVVISIEESVISGHFPKRWPE